MPDDKHRNERLSAIAQKTLHHFDETAARVRESLAERQPDFGNVLAYHNAATDTLAINKLTEIAQSRLRELHSLLREPAVARVITQDEHGKERTYFVSRATPHRSPTDGSLAVSYNVTPLGRLAALPVGGEMDAPTRDGVRRLTVIESTKLHPREEAGVWDSRNSVVEGRAFGPFTIASLRALLAQVRVPEHELDVLEAALADDRAAALIIEGLRRDVLKKMELRDLAVLDEYQDEIFRLPLDTQLVILGPPGTGKTTTLIKRLGQKLDLPNLTDDERDTVASTIAGRAGHETSWLMFTPTTLLQQYVAKAFASENIAATDDRVRTWDDCRRDLARNHFSILRSASAGQYVLKESPPLASLLSETVKEQRAWFEDFHHWQSDAFWSDLSEQSGVLTDKSNSEFLGLGTRIKDALPARPSDQAVGTFSQLASLEEPLRTSIGSLKATTDKALRGSIANELRKDERFLIQLTAFVGTLQDNNEADDLDAEDEDETPQIRLGGEAAVESLMRALRAKARATVTGRSLTKQTKSGGLIEWLGARGPQQDELKALGKTLRVQSAARRFLNPVGQLLSGVPRRYRRFRRERQNAGLWYRSDGFGANDLNPLEVDIILLSILKTGVSLLKDRRITRDAHRNIYAPLALIRSLLRTQILVDEATDFSPIQLACMESLCDPASRSFVACGDFNQRITEWGSRSEDDLRWAAPEMKMQHVSITYRHSRQLNELARAIALISSPDVSEAQLPRRVNNDGFDPVLGTSLVGPAVIAEWLASRIAEIERLTDEVPPIAVLVNTEEEVAPITDALNDVLTIGNLRAVPCRSGQLAGQDNDVRVFNVQHIKGLEFEAVFFVGVDRLAKQHPELFEKFLYVGATRAAMYLGLTTGGSGLPHKMRSVEHRFKQQWP